MKSSSNVIQNMKQLCLCTSSLSIEHHYMQQQHDAASHSPTHDTHDRKENSYFIMITTATYLWNKPRKHVLSHMHPTEHVKKYKTIVNNGSCIYVSFIVFMCKAPSGSILKYSHWLKEPLYTHKHVSY